LAEDDGFEEGFGELFAFAVEVGGGFELEAEFFVGLRSWLSKTSESVVTAKARARLRSTSSGVRRGGAGFVAADLGDVDADAVREGLLGEAALVACGCESFGEAHEVGDGRRCWWGDQFWGPTR
jgi:hypothetical protein